MEVKATPIEKVEISEATISAEKKLKITIIEGPIISPGAIININAGGIVGSLRGVKDGYSYFGTSPGEV